MCVRALNILARQRLSLEQCSLTCDEEVGASHLDRGALACGPCGVAAAAAVAGDILEAAVAVVPDAAAAQERVVRAGSELHNVVCKRPAIGIGLALKILAPKSRPPGACY